MRRPQHRRDGFVLLAVLWMLTGGAALGMLLVLTARDAQGIATNRIELARARWIAEGCVEQARAAVEETIDGDAIDDSAWAGLDRVILESPMTRGCRMSVAPVGTTLGVNVASESQLRRGLVEAGVSPATADSITAAILDWRDPDDTPREFGAERDWYDHAGRSAPRNADVASAEELAMIRGMERLSRTASLLGTDPGRILLSRAPRAVIATLPGMTPPVLDEIDRRRLVGDSVGDVIRLAALVDSASREQLLATRAALADLVTALPDAWLIAAEASEGRPTVTARLEVRVVRSGRRLAIMRRRSDS
jgi:general secretion pathway protein K